MNVTYVSACLDSSGYAEAGRNYIAALHYAGVKVNVVPVKFESYTTELGELGNLVQSLIEKNPQGKIRIMHVTPDNFPRIIQKDKYNIGYAAWETSKIPKHWVPACNKLDELWVPCEHNKVVFAESGVTVPIYVFPHTFNTEIDSPKSTTDLVRKGDEYIFYSIFQWTERKNPVDLLVAYLTEFKPEENVSLVIKSYIQNPKNPDEANKMRQQISMVKQKLYLSAYPKLFMVNSLLSREQIFKLHQECDCYISLHRCEGFGIPIVEAMMEGKPAIATNYGGPEDFLPGNGYPVDYKLTPCLGMPWPLYTGHMEWASPDIMQARKHMRYVYENREEAKKVGLAGRDKLKENLSWTKIGNAMKARLEEIERNL